MQLTVRPVDIKYAAQIWPLVKPFLEKALEASNVPKDSWCYTIEHVQVFISSGEWMLLVMVDELNTIHGAMTITFINYPMQRAAFITLFGGKGVTNKHIDAQVKNLCRLNGATILQAYATGSRLRLWRKFGLEANTTMIGVKL